MEFSTDQAVVNFEQSSAEDVSNPLRQFSLRGQYEGLAARKLKEVYVLQGIALLGQATVLYAAPNTGKTLVSLALLKEAIASGRVQAQKVFYINADDSFNGAVDKLGLTEEQSFHYLVPGHAGFDVDKLRGSIVEMIETNTARGTVLVLDTLKKFVDLMDKSKARDFSALVRAFVSKGGTVLAFAHTNKNVGADGKRQYGGTSDIVDDFDCAYIMSDVPGEHPHGSKLVEFRNVKSRGAVEQSVCCSYADGADVSYAAKLESVRLLSETELADMKRKAQKAHDANLIEAISKCISDGIGQKMKIEIAVRESTGESRRAIFRVLDAYCGTDKSVHLWTFRRVSKGAMAYSLLTPWVDPSEF